MNTGAPVALGIGVGYLLGRNHKFKWALILGTAAATGSFKGLPAQLLERGNKLLQSSPELEKLTGNAQKLLDAGRTAAMSAMSSRVDSMGESLEGRVKQTTRLGDSDTERDERSGGGGRRRRDRDEEPEDQASEDEEPEDEEPEDEEPEDEEPEDYDEPDDEAEFDEDEDEDAQPAPSRGGGRGSSTSGRRAVVRKGGR